MEVPWPLRCYLTRYRRQPLNTHKPLIYEHNQH